MEEPDRDSRGLFLEPSRGLGHELPRRSYTSMMLSCKKTREYKEQDL